ncbi:MAG: hypothetical protein NTX63_01380 [Candidatus Peregrinibacteria bacterium]|nr:hypothetical protein [Candidatus Peregrinibacteria bacterium]
METPRSHIVIIADSLTNDFVGAGFEQNNVHVGKDESQRILGTAENGWSGPVPTFLRAAVKAQKNGENVGIISVRDLHDPNDPKQIPELLLYGTHAIAGTPGAELAEPIAEIYRDAHIEHIDVTALSIPINALRGAVLRITGIDMITEPEYLDRIKFLAMGSHTNIRVFDNADSLKHKFGCPDVSACPQLVASSNLADHHAALRQWLPGKLIRVIQGVKNLCEHLGIEPPSPEAINWTEACELEPATLLTSLNHDQRAILEAIFMDRDSVKLTPLGGGFSGSLLFLATARKGNTVMEPVIIKIDKHRNIKREADGYGKVKDMLGGRVPGFDPPVSMGEYTGVKIGLAALRGKPRTFQSVYESANTDASIADAIDVFQESLDVLQEKLYANTRRTKKINPITQLSLQLPLQPTWLKNNISNILPGSEDSDELTLTDSISVPNPLHRFSGLQQSKTVVDADVCVMHRDLNFANHILDARKNVWFIDWANCDDDIVEVDFAKMENDIKFVMAKEFTEDALHNLCAFETFALAHIDLPSIDSLPSDLAFIESDIRFKKMYQFLTTLRKSYISVKGHNIDATSDEAHLYKAALLRYSLHTLSFDARTGRGECGIASLKHALYSTSKLVQDLSSPHVTE